MALNKQELLARAARGEDRPNKKKGPLGIALCNYTRLKSGCYDPVFDQQIRQAAPHWFLDTAAVKKAELLARAARGEDRPAVHGKNKHPLGQVLGIYTNPKDNMYDPVFDQQIRQVAPGWFIRADKLRAARKETVNA